MIGHLITLDKKVKWNNEKTNVIFQSFFKKNKTFWSPDKMISGGTITELILNDDLNTLKVHSQVWHNFWQLKAL